MNISSITSDISGCVFDIREFSLFDGPGVRTSVFLKGCPLRCVWCHNPEGLNASPEILFSISKCIHCGSCKDVCPLRGNDKCLVCGKCASACPSQARRVCGRFITPMELLNEVLKSQPVFEISNGGVTFTGGEPLMQIDFVVETAKLLHDKGVSVAVETSGYSSAETYQKLLDVVDFIFQDVKHTDDAMHKRYTGVSNKPILANLELLKTSGKTFVVRAPLIPTVNDSQKNLLSLAEKLLDADNLQGVELLPYHSSSGGKYSLLNLTPPMTFQEKTFGDEVLEPFRKHGLPVRLL